MADPKFAPENFRQILHSGYTLIRSIETNKAVSALTLDHLLQNHIDALKKGTIRASATVDDNGNALPDGRGNSISRWDQIDEIEKLFTQAVNALKKAGSNTEKLAQLGIDASKTAKLVKGDFEVTSDGTPTV